MKDIEKYIQEKAEEAGERYDRIFKKPEMWNDAQRSFLILEVRRAMVDLAIGMTQDFTSKLKQ